jgi:hypothetical protein
MACKAIKAFKAYLWAKNLWIATLAQVNFLLHILLPFQLA